MYIGTIKYHAKFQNIWLNDFWDVNCLVNKRKCYVDNEKGLGLIVDTFRLVLFPPKVP